MGYSDNGLAFVGTALKYKVEITADGFSMDDDDFSVEVRRGLARSITIPKEGMIQNEEGFSITIDTNELGAGKYEVITRAYVPDTDFDGGVRQEVDKQTLIIVNDL